MQQCVVETIRTQSYPLHFLLDLAAGRGGNQGSSPDGCLMFSFSKVLDISGISTLLQVAGFVERSKLQV